MLLNQIVITTSQTDYLLSTPNNFDEDIRRSRVFATKEEAEKSKKDVVSNSGRHGLFEH